MLKVRYISLLPKALNVIKRTFVTVYQVGSNRSITLDISSLLPGIQLPYTYYYNISLSDAVLIS